MNKNVPYYKKELLGNMEVTYYGCGVIELAVSSNGDAIKTIMDLNELEAMAKKCRNHMEEYKATSPSL
jgi:hypothetical protein